MKKYIIICLLFVNSIVLSQETTPDKVDVNPFRIGLKIGVPNGLGGNIEYVTPIFNNRVALFVDYSYVKAKDFGKLNYFEAGTNIYFSNKGRGLYGSFSYGKLNIEEDSSDEDYENEVETLNTSTFNIKLGAKLGRKFYFRIEAGYGFGEIPMDIVELEIPTISENGTPIFNIGFGYSF